MRYNASLDTAAKIITGCITLLFAVIIFNYVFLKNELNSIYISICIILTAVYILAFAFRPIGYSLNSTHLIIHRPIADLKIERPRISSAVLIDRSDIGFAIRIFAVGGLFGYFGKYWSPKEGSITYYATQKDNLILVITREKRKFIITPKNAEEFINDLKSLEFISGPANGI